jgi:hypothetical protein
MTHDSPTAVELARAAEQLRQEQETFNQQKAHENRWFTLRLVMGYTSVALLAAILFVSSYILFHPAQFSAPVGTAAGGALFVDAVGLVVSVWKGVLQPSSGAKLAPVTKSKVKLGGATSSGQLAPGPQASRSDEGSA